MNEPQLSPRTARALTSAADCRRALGWEVIAQDGEPWLRLSWGMTAVLVSASRGSEVLRTCRERDQLAPVLEVFGNSPSWVFLTDDNGVVLAQDALPAGVRLLRSPSALPLPTPSIGMSRWIVPLALDHRWLPTLTTVLSTLRAAS